MVDICFEYFLRASSTFSSKKCKWSQLLMKTAWESYEALFIAPQLNWVKGAFSKSKTYLAKCIEGPTIKKKLESQMKF